MRKVIMGVAAVALMVSGASATLNTPKKAGSFKSDMIRRYDACSAINTSAGALSLPACQPAVLSGTCNFDPLVGYGVVNTAVVSGATKADIKIGASLKGLTCNGVVLCPVASVRVSTTGCTTGADCTIIDLVDFQSGLNDGNATTFECCTVASGKCKIKTTVNTGGLPSNTFEPGKKTQLELRGLSLVDATSGNVEFTAGAYVP